MARLRSVLSVGVMLCALCLIGCDKEVKLTFVNLTPEALRVNLLVPGEGARRLGVVGADGGKLRHKLKLDKDLLPVTCRYRAGRHAGSFTVTRRSEKKLWIDIRPLGPPRVRDRHTVVEDKTRIEIRDVPVRREEVVE